MVEAERAKGKKKIKTPNSRLGKVTGRTEKGSDSDMDRFNAFS